MKKIVDLNKSRTGVVIRERPSGSLIVQWHYDIFGERTVTAKELKERANEDRRCYRYIVKEIDESKID